MLVVVVGIAMVVEVVVVDVVGNAVAVLHMLVIVEVVVGI